MKKYYFNDGKNQTGRDRTIVMGNKKKLTYELKTETQRTGWEMNKCLNTYEVYIRWTTVYSWFAI